MMIQEKIAELEFAIHTEMNRCYEEGKYIATINTIDACKSLIMETLDNDLLVGTLVLRLYKLKEELLNGQEKLL